MSIRFPDRIGTPLSPSATRVMLLGCGELGKEVIIALQRLGVEVIGVDRYADAPGMQVAHRRHETEARTDEAALRGRPCGDPAMDDHATVSGAAGKPPDFTSRAY